MKLFFELLQVALLLRTFLSSTPSEEEWNDIYEISKKHTLVGIAYSGIERLPSEQKPNLSFLWGWHQDVLNIEKNNELILEKSQQIIRRLKQDNVNATILKGQSLRFYYPTNLQKRRSTGDIDFWITSISWKTSKGVSGINNFQSDSSIRSIVKYAHSVLPGQFLCYIHYDFPVFSKVHTELHIRPSFLCHPLYNHRLQKWFIEIKKLLPDGINTPIPACIQSLFILLHIQKHLFEDGIGIRQLIDLYLVEKQIHATKDYDYRSNIINQIGLSQFDKDLHFALNTILGIQTGICSNSFLEKDKKRGIFLLNEIMQSGNFGHMDSRINHNGGKVRHAIEKFKHNMRLLWNYPSEVLWEPPFRLYHWLWRVLKLWRWE